MLNFKRKLAAAERSAAPPLHQATVQRKHGTQHWTVTCGDCPTPSGSVRLPHLTAALHVRDRHHSVFAAHYTRALRKVPRRYFTSPRGPEKARGEAAEQASQRTRSMVREAIVYLGSEDGGRWLSMMHRPVVSDEWPYTITCDGCGPAERIQLLGWGREDALAIGALHRESTAAGAGRSLSEDAGPHLVAAAERRNSAATPGYTLTDDAVTADFDALRECPSLTMPPRRGRHAAAAASAS